MNPSNITNIATAAYTATVATPTPGDNDPATNEVQTITLDDANASATGGTFTITYAGQTTAGIAYDADAATILAALEALSNIEEGHVSVSGTLNDGITITFGAVVTITASVAETVQGAGPSTDEVQTVSLGVDQVATGGTFTLTYSGQTTAAIAYDADAATIQAALEALSNLAPGDVGVTGSLNSDIVITFGGTLAATNVDAMTVSVASTTGVSALSATDVAAVTVSLASTTFSTLVDVTTGSAHLRAVSLTGGSDAAVLTVRAGGASGTTVLVVKAAAATTVSLSDLHDALCSGGIHATMTGAAASASLVHA